MALVSVSGYWSNKKLKRLLIGVLIVTVGTLVALFVGHRNAPHEPPAEETATDSQADMTIQKVVQTALRNGIKEWHLEAAAAELMESEKKLILEKPSVEFFLEDGKNAFLTADRGVLRIDTQDIDVSGNVLVTRGNFKLKTSRLYYVHETRTLSSQKPVHIAGQGFSLDANSMVIDLNRKRSLFKGGVEGLFRERIEL